MFKLTSLNLNGIRSEARKGLEAGVQKTGRILFVYGQVKAWVKAQILDDDLSNTLVWSLAADGIAEPLLTHAEYLLPGHAGGAVLVEQLARPCDTTCENVRSF